MVWTVDTSLLDNVFTSVSLNAIQWAISIMFIMILIVFVTRDKEQWKLLMLPMGVAMDILGLNVPYAYYLIAGIIYVQASVSFQRLGNLAHAIGGLSPQKKTIKKTSNITNIITPIEKKSVRFKNSNVK